MEVSHPLLILLVRPTACWIPGAPMRVMPEFGHLQPHAALEKSTVFRFLLT